MAEPAETAPANPSADALAASVLRSINLGTATAAVEKQDATCEATGIPGLPEDIAALLAASWPRPVRVEELARRTGRPVPTLLGALTQARLVGTVAESVEGVRLRRAPSTADPR